MLYQPTARTRVAGSFPNTAACLRLISMLIVGKTKTGPRGDFGSPVFRLPSLVLYREANIANHVSDQVDGSKRTYPINDESPRRRQRAAEPRFSGAPDESSGSGRSLPGDRQPNATNATAAYRQGRG